MDQVRLSDESTIMKATSYVDHVKKAENGHPDIKRSGPEVRLPADIHADAIDQGKVAKVKYTGTKEPRRKANLLMNSESVDKIEICKPTLEHINTNDADMFEEEIDGNMQPDDKETGTKSDLSLKNHSVVTCIKKEVEENHSKTSEPDREAKMVNIDVQNHGVEVENMQPNRKVPDTESDLLEKTHPIGICIKEEDENEHPGPKERQLCEWCQHRR